MRVPYSCLACAHGLHVMLFLVLPAFMKCSTALASPCCLLLLTLLTAALSDSDTAAISCMAVAERGY